MRRHASYQYYIALIPVNREALLAVSNNKKITAIHIGPLSSDLTRQHCQILSLESLF